MRDSFATQEEFDVYRAYYSYAYFLYSNWDKVSAHDKEIEGPSNELAFLVASAIFVAEAAQIPQERIYDAQVRGMRDAMLRVNKEGGPYRVRYLVIQPGASGKMEWRSGSGEAPEALISGLTHENPVKLDEQGMYVDVYRDPGVPATGIADWVGSLVRDGQLN